MLFNIPLAIIFGILTVISLFVTAGLGVSSYYFKKKVFKYHKIFAFLTLTLAAVHSILAFLLWFYGIVV
jgi:hypothetical protein